MFFELSNATVFNRTKNKNIICYRVQISIICKKIMIEKQLLDTTLVSLKTASKGLVH